MSGADTRQRILDVSLDLFSQYGFTAVSIRDICKRIKIKESSVYYHFTNKRAILEELKARFEAAAGALMDQLYSAVREPFLPDSDMGESISEPYFDQYLMDDFCNSFMRILFIEQSNSAEMRQIYDKWLFQEPLSFQSRVFSVLIRQGVFRPGDSEYMAVKFYAPVFLYFERYLLSGDLTEEKKELFRRKANEHIQHFFRDNGGL